MSKDKTKEELRAELETLRQRIAELETAEIQRIQAEENLRKSEEKYRLISENIPVLVYSALPDKHSTNLFVSGQSKELTGYSTEEFLKNPDLWSTIVHPEKGFQYVNPAFEELTGYTAVEVYGENFSFWDIIHPDDVDMIRERELARARHEEVSERYEFRVIASDGTVKTVEAITVDMAEQETLIMGIIRDNTQRKQAEKERERAMELEKRFKADAAHFFLNPIAICKGYMDIAMEEMGDTPGEKIRIAKRAIHRVEAVIENVVTKGEIRE